METVEVAGQRIAFQREGHGPPLLLLHGMPGDSRIWRRQIRDFADAFTVVAWDAPGFGQSSAPEGDFGTDDVVRYLIEFVEALRLERPHVLGLSWGGGLALGLYREAPMIPRTLLLVGGYAGWAGSLPEDGVAMRLDAYERASRMPGHEAMREWAPGFFSSSAAADAVNEFLAIASEYDPRVLLTLSRSFARTDLRAMLHTIDVPTLLLYGDADVRSPLYVAEALHAAIRGSTLTVLPGVGHISNFEAPERFHAEIRNFLRTHADENA